jgi:hypothetical protein
MVGSKTGTPKRASSGHRGYDEQGRVASFNPASFRADDRVVA